MNPNSIIDDAAQPAGGQQDAGRSYNFEAKKDYFATIGLAATILLHRLNNVTARLGIELTRLRNCVDGNAGPAMDRIDDIEAAIKGLDELNKAVHALRDPHGVPEEIDVNSLLYEVWEALSKNYADVGCDFDLPDDIPPVHTEINLMAEVFRIVLENSFEAVDRQAGHIEIQTRCLDARISVKISDNGPGVPEGIRARLFQQPLKSANPGKGMGLWLANLFLSTRLGGDIQLWPAEAGQGSVVVMNIPVHETSDTSGDESDEQE